MSSRSDLAGGAGWMAFGLVILVGSWRMERFESMGATVYTAPGLVPGLFGLLLVLLGALLAWRGRHAADGAGPAPLLNGRIALTLLLTLGYALGAVGHVPFLPATAVFVGLFCALFADGGSWLRRAAIGTTTGVLTAVAIVLVFERVFLVRLP
ncbi:MAG: tripartite tricarboxylate transporter TctB family protein [Piscinibacter sp.]|nr:tripartite tricarboxylate transporter TctB family protein [Piscinibacter sp.]